MSELTKEVLKEHEILLVATTAAIAAGKVLNSYFGNVVTVPKEGTGNITTQADTASEKIITDYIKRYFPGHSILGEEGTASALDSDYLWSVDPLDGTLRFANGLPGWGVSIGILKNHQPVAGIIYQPQENALYSAIKGQGAYLNKARLTVNNKNKLSDALVGFDYGYYERSQRIDQLRKIAPHVRYTMTEACATSLLGQIAEGKMDGYINPGLEHWDIAAAALIIEESGGRISDLSGQPLVWTPGKQFDLAASNGHIHDQLLHTLRS